MEAYEAILKRRSIRQFSKKEISIGILQKLGDAGGVAPNAANMQPLKFIIINKPNEEIFDFLKWAGYLPEWTPPKEKQPRAYVIILADSKIRKTGYEIDVGLAAENIMIAATGFGLGSCCLGIHDKDEMLKILKLPKRYVPVLVIALGYPAEESKAEEMKDSVKYWRDEKEKMHVPKRKNTVYFNSIGENDD